MNSQHYHNLIRSDLRPEITGTEAVAHYAEKVLEFFEKHDPKHHVHLSFRSFNDLLDATPATHPHLAAALLYLSNRIPLLKLGFEVMYETEDGVDFIQYSPEEISQAEKTGALVNKDTGEIVEDYKDQVLIYYEPTALAHQLYAEH